MTQVTFPGFPRIGAQRELKQALESHWRGELDASGLLKQAQALRARHWQLARAAGADSVPVNDFSLYDHMLDTAVLFDAIPERYRELGARDPLAGYFAMARGARRTGFDLHALEMTKWFDTNYHYLVPELHRGQKFALCGRKPLDEYREARALGYAARPVLVGPVTFLYLSKTTDGSVALDLLDALLPAYGELLAALRDAGADWVQLDEPVLATDLDARTRDALLHAYTQLAGAQAPHLLLANYFGGFGDNLAVLAKLPVQGVHADLVRGRDELDRLLEILPAGAILSAGVVDGRNIWRSQPGQVLPVIEEIQARLGNERLWLSTSCSLLHVPMDVSAETGLEDSLRSWLAFAHQKIGELRMYADALDGKPGARSTLRAQEATLAGRANAPGVTRAEVRARLASIGREAAHRHAAYSARRVAQERAHPLPLLPTTTIGSFPQTDTIRKARAAHRAGRLNQQGYEQVIAGEIEHCIRFQEQAGLDVLVHGEAERNDMVEYFGEQLDGFAFTHFGWVQSYGSRCVKPPLIYGDVARPHAMTVRWSKYAQSLTAKPVKGMLTGPVTMTQWSFVRDDLPRASVCRQIALALRDEVQDLEAAGIEFIQIDEPAFREALPLRRAGWQAYLDWAVECFHLATGGARDTTQIHTHMCYSEFNDIIEAVAAMDADVISIETSRSRMELLDAFTRFDYPNGIGPGVYDIHSPRVPSADEITVLLDKALKVLKPEQLWVNPDCGLKTRRWEEVEPALTTLVQATRALRSRIAAAA
ncbi:MAG: 5-methyltetrahydropteroyltriglutamate--homocysteine S-methyltransferase [Gammaproteobacteria bacterium]